MRFQRTGAVVTARAYAVAFPRAMREPLIADVSLRIIRLIQTLALPPSAPPTLSDAPQQVSFPSLMLPIPQSPPELSTFLSLLWLNLKFV